MSDGRVVIDTRLDPDGATRGLSNLHRTTRNQTQSMENDFDNLGRTGVRSMNNIKDSTNQLGSVLKKVGGLLASAFAINKLIQVGKQAINIASDVQEVQNVVDTAFGDMSYKMEQFADIAIETYGISKLTAKQTGSTMMAMAKGLGLASDEASDMAINITALSADMASFYNISQDVASTALKSIFTGETETLKRFGIVMTEANLSAFALSQGINKSLKNMTQAEKVQLRYAYVMQQTSLAQGDFAKTSDSWANQTRILSERWKEFLSIAGNGLIKLLTPALKAINELMQQLIEGISILADYFGFAFEATATKGVSDMESAMEDYAEATEQAKKAQDKLLGGYDKLNVISKNKTTDNNASSGMLGTNTSGKSEINVKKTTKSLGIIGEAFKNLSTYFKFLTEDLNDLGSSFIKVFKSDVMPMLNTFIQNSIERFTHWGTVVGKVFTDFWRVYAYPNMRNFINYGIPLFSQFATQVDSLFTNISTSIADVFSVAYTNVISPTLAELTKIMTDVWIIATDVWNEYGKSVFDGINEAVINMKDIIVNVFDKVVSPIWSNLIKALDKVWKNGFKPLLTNVGKFVSELVNVVTKILNKFITPLVTHFTNKLSKPITKIINTIINTVASMASSFSSALNSIVSVFRNVISVISAIVDGDWKKAWNGVKSIFSNIWSAIKSAIKGITTPLQEIISFITGKFNSAWKKAWEGITDVFEKVWNGMTKFLKGVINSIIGIVNKMIEAIETGINFVIKCLNKLSFDVPKWVPGIGGETFGFDVSKVKMTKIPYLATGAVLPANKPFLSVVGDQKHGTNVEAPLDTIKQALIEALKSTGTNNGDIVVQIDGREVFRAVQNQNNKYGKMYGKSVLI